jgi:lysophospholipase L1-like esterase
MRFLVPLLALAVTAQAAEPLTPLNVFMAGDSTMADKPLVPANAERGWGQLLPICFVPEVRVENYAANGRSSKSFRAEGKWKIILDRLKPGDYVIIQFGHNDEKSDEARHTEPLGSFAKNLRRFIAEVRERNGLPILATPVARRVFKDGKLEDTHGDYPAATRKVAEEEKVPLLEMNTKSMDLLTKLGPDLSLKLFNHLADGEFDTKPKAQSDNTHFNAFGASRMCDLALEEIKAKVPDLAKYIRVVR